jgi:hypothetical protein
VNRVKHKVDMGRLSQVACYFPSFADVRGGRTRCDFLDLGDVVGYLLAMAQEGAFVGCDFHSGETSVWMLCGLGNAVKNYVVISWLCTKGSVRMAK